MKALSSFVKRDNYSFERKSEDIPQILIIFGGSFCTLMMGIMVTWTSPSIPKLLEPEYGITMEDASYLAVIDPIAMIAGSPFFPKLADKIGRKPVMGIVSLLFGTCFLITAFTRNIYILYISRIFAGLGYACTFSSLPTYIGEVTTPKIRSKYGHILMTMIFTGQFLSNLVGVYCDIPTMAYILLGVPIVALLSLYFMPESPYYYIMKNNLKKARRSLEILRGTKGVDVELNSIASAVERQLRESGHFKDLFLIRSNRRALIICNIARGIQQLCGINAFMTFGQYLFEKAGTQIANGIATVIFAGMLAVTNIFSNIVCDKVGKRLAMVYSCIGVFLTLAGETIFFFLQQYTNVDTTEVNWFPLLGLAIFVIFFCIGQSNVPTLLLGELFSSNIKQHGIMIMNIAFAAYMAGVNKLFQYLMTTFGLCVPFFMFTIFAFASIFLSYYMIPETKGKTLEEIQMMLKGT